MSERKVPTCGSCMWWSPTYGDQGQCRLKSPMMDTASGRGVWPITGKQWVCHEFEAGKGANDE